MFGNNNISLSSFPLFYIYITIILLYYNLYWSYLNLMHLNALKVTRKKEFILREKFSVTYHMQCRFQCRMIYKDWLVLLIVQNRFGFHM